MRADAFHQLAAQLGEADHAFAQIGPLVLLRVPGSLSCGVLTAAELNRVAGTDPGDLAQRDPGLRIAEIDEDMALGIDRNSRCFTKMDVRRKF